MILDRTLSIAPMMAYTDRHFRVLMRLLNKNILLYTEMVTSASLLQGDPVRQLAFSAVEKPLALQLGGADPQELALCAKMAQEWGYDEVNLNVGCPSDRVQSGNFGACLMKTPALVADCVASMRNAVTIPITVKTRIGVDDQDSFEAFHNFISQVKDAGCQIFIIHARKAWLKGLSPRQNRSIPALRYDWVYQIKREFPELQIVINGGIRTREEIEQHLNYVDGVMIGREAYDNPMLFAESRILVYEIIWNYLPYMAQELQKGTPLSRMSRHLMGLMQGQPGAKQWRRWLSTWREATHNLEELQTCIKAQPVFLGVNSQN
jgi:tRNA-dihydrouridine synthase A